MSTTIHTTTPMRDGLYEGGALPMGAIGSSASGWWGAWVLMLSEGTGGVVNPPGSYQCFAVSRTGDPVAGGWNFYSLHITDALQDYPKFGI